MHQRDDKFQLLGWLFGCTGQIARTMHLALLDVSGKNVCSFLQRDLRLRTNPPWIEGLAWCLLMQHINTGFYHGDGTLCPSVT